MRDFRPIAISLICSLAIGIVLIPTSNGQEAGVSGGNLLDAAQRALSGGAAINDVTFSGTVRHIAGATDENGRAELKALATGETSVDLTYPSGSTREVYARSERGLIGQRSSQNQKPHAISEHNLLVDPAWFCPVLILQRVGTASDRIVTVVRQAASSQHSRDHLRVSRKPTSEPTSDQTVNSITKRVLDAFNAAPQIDFYLDSTTHLPTELAFNLHPDNNLGENVPIRVKYSDYRPVNGLQVPFHLQKFMNGTLMWDVELESANFNSGLAANSFVVTEKASRRAAQ